MSALVYAGREMNGDVKSRREIGDLMVVDYARNRDREIVPTGDMCNRENDGNSGRWGLKRESLWEFYRPAPNGFFLDYLFTVIYNLELLVIDVS